MHKTNLAINQILLRQRENIFHWITVFFACGIGIYFSLWRDLTLFELCLLLPFVACLGFISVRLTPLSQSLAWLCCALIIGIFGGGLRTHWVKAPILGWPYYGEVRGQVINIDRSASDALRVTLDKVWVEKISSQRTPRRVRISLFGTAGNNVTIGMTVSVVAYLMPPQGPAEPDGFDFQRYIWFQGIGAVGYTKKTVIVVENPEGRLALFWPRQQEKFSRSIRTNLPERTSGLAAAIMSGDRSFLSKQVTEDLRRSNLAHLLAISGLHMGLLCTVVFGFVRSSVSLLWPTLMRVDAKKLAAVFALGFALVYLLISGASISTQRSYIMVSVMLGAVLLDRQVLSLRMVSLAALLILGLRPESLFGPGFQMSFAATIALVITFRYFNQVFPRALKFIKPLLVLVISSLVAGLATAPYSAAHFNQISHLGLFANLVAVPMMSMIVAPFALLAVVLTPVGGEAIGYWGVNFGLDWILTVAEFISQKDIAVSYVSMPPTYFIPLFSIATVFFTLWNGRARLIAVPAILMLCLVWGMHRRPTILIDANGDLVGRMTPEGRALSKPKGAGFVASIWMENDGARMDQTEAFLLWQEESVFHIWSKRDAGRVISCRSGQIFVYKVDIQPDGNCTKFDMRYWKNGSIAIWLNEKGRIEQIKTAKNEHYNRMWTR